jgi:hypothetical protein
MGKHFFCPVMKTGFSPAVMQALAQYPVILAPHLASLIQPDRVAGPAAASETEAARAAQQHKIRMQTGRLLRTIGLIVARKRKGPPVRGYRGPRTCGKEQSYFAAGSFTISTLVTVSVPLSRLPFRVT